MPQARSEWKAYKEVPAYDYMEEEDQVDAAISIAARTFKKAHVNDGSHQRGKEVADAKRQATEVAPGDQIRQKTMKHNDAGRANASHPSHHGTGYVPDLFSPTTQMSQNLIMDKAAMSPADKAATYTASVLESRALACSENDKSNEGASMQATARPQMSMAKSPAQQGIEDIALPKYDVAGASVEPEHEASTVGSSMEFEAAQCPGWQELLEFMEMSKSRLLEDESTLKFLRSLEPRIVDGSRWFFEPHTLFLALARMANVSKRRERFEEYLVEAPREWYCLTTVCRHGYDAERARASQEDCGCPQRRKTCIQARIRRGKLGGFDVRFR